MKSEQMTMTEEQYQRYAAILNDVERLRMLSRAEKERIIRGILDTTFIDLTCDWALLFSDLIGD